MDSVSEEWYLIAAEVDGRREDLAAEVRPIEKPGEEGLLLMVGDRTEEGVLVGPILVIVIANQLGYGRQECHLTRFSRRRTAWREIAQYLVTSPPRPRLTCDFVRRETLI